MSRKPDPSSAVAPRRPPRPKWILILAVFGMFVSVLITNGLISSQVGIDATGAANDGPDNAVPGVISNGGPVIDLTNGRVDSLQMPPKTVALSFDDGPDPEWTPQILAVLAKYHVPGTFFEIGSRVAHYPDLVRQVRAPAPRSACTPLPTPTCATSRRPG